MKIIRYIMSMKSLVLGLKFSQIYKIQNYANIKQCKTIRKSPSKIFELRLLYFLN